MGNKRKEWQNHYNDGNNGLSDIGRFMREQTPKNNKVRDCGEISERDFYPPQDNRILKTRLKGDYDDFWDYVNDYYELGCENDFWEE